MKTFLMTFLLILLLGSTGTVVLASEKPAIDAAVEKINTGFGAEIITTGADDPSVKAQGIIGGMIKILLGIMGTIALCIFIYSGIMWMTAGGTEARVTTAQNSMIWAALGLFAVFVSYMIIKFLVGSLTF